MFTLDRFLIHTVIYQNWSILRRSENRHRCMSLALFVKIRLYTVLSLTIRVAVSRVNRIQIVLTKPKTAQNRVNLLKKRVFHGMDTRHRTP